MEREFDKFALSLLLTFVDLKEDQSVFAQTVALHLKDIVARANKTQALGGGSLAVVGYLKHQMLGMVELMESVSQSLENEQSFNAEALSKLCKCCLKLQLIIIDIFESPAGTALDCFCQLSAQLRQMLSKISTMEQEVMETLKHIVKNDL